MEPKDIRRINRSRILEVVRRRSPISRTEISRRLDISLPTATRIVDELMNERFVRATGESLATKGRPRELLELDRDSHLVIGVDLGGTNMFGALANIGGGILDEIRVPGHNTQGLDSLNKLSRLIEELISSSEPASNRLRGIAIGVPGVTRHSAGIVEWAPSLNWREFALKERLEERLGRNVFVENDVSLAALGEHWFGKGQDTRSMVLIAVGTGIGAGIILDGTLYRGHSECAGEIGYLVPSREMLGQSYPHFGALESLASGTAISQRATALLAGEQSMSAVREPTSQEVFEAARRGEDWARELASEAADYLAIAVANVSVLLDPELIILGGGVSASADLLIDAIIQRIDGMIPRVPRIEASTLGRRAAVMGCIPMVFNAATESLTVAKSWVSDV